MACIHHEIVIDASPDEVWEAVRDVGNVHRKLVPGFVVDCKLEGDTRTVVFANGLTVRELIVDIDEAARRVAYAVVGGRAIHHHASMQVESEAEGRSRLIWITDVLPHELADAIRANVEQGSLIMQRTLARR